MILIFANNAKTTLSLALTSTSTTLSVAPGTGSLFPSPAGNQYFVLTLTDAATGLINEIIWVTSRAGDVFTILRGQEGTSAQSWLFADFASCFPTAGTQATFTQPDQLQKGTYEYAVASGTVNALTATVTSDLTSLPDGMPLTIKASGANTLQVTLGSTILSISPIVKGGNQTLVAGDNPAAGYPMKLNWSSTFNAWVMQNPATGVSVLPVGSIFQFPATAAPTGFLIAEGQLLSRTTYANLWTFAQASGNIVADGSWAEGNFSTGDGSTTFRIPQYGGYFLRSLDNGNGIDSGRVIGTVQAGQNQIHTHSASTILSGSASTTIIDTGHVHTEGIVLTGLLNGVSGPAVGNGGTQFSGGGSSNFGFGGTPYPTNTATTGITATTSLAGLSGSTIIANSSGAIETRVINISVLTCIKY